MTDTTDLRRLAEAATPGPWQRYSPNTVTRGTDTEEVIIAWDDVDAAYIAAASPDRILALLAERDALLAVAEAARVLQDTDGFDTFTPAADMATYELRAADACGQAGGCEHAPRSR